MKKMFIIVLLLSLLCYALAANYSFSYYSSYLMISGAVLMFIGGFGLLRLKRHRDAEIAEKSQSAKNEIPLRSVEGQPPRRNAEETPHSVSNLETQLQEQSHTDKTAPLIGIIALIAVIVFSTVKSSSLSESRNPSETAKPAVQHIWTADQLAKNCIDSANELFPDHTNCIWDKSVGILTVQIWIDGSNVAAEYAKAGNKDAQASWDELINSLIGASAEWQKNFDNAGFDVMVVMRLLNPDNHDLALASTRRGALTYDCVSGLLK